MAAPTAHTAAMLPVLRARAVPCHFVPSLGTLAAYPVQLSSHALTISTTDTTSASDRKSKPRAYLFGGERIPRQPAGDELRVITDLDSVNPEDNERTDVLTRPRDVEAGVGWPAPRVGASLSADGRGFLWLWGGRGGKEMAPLEGDEVASIWRFDTASSAWERFDTHTATGHDEDRPQGRSYHAAAVLDGKLYIHAGCPASGRLSTLHALDLNTLRWKALASAPGPARGGTALAAIPSPYSSNPSDRVLARWGGFCGEEIGGPLDIYAPSTDSWTSYTAPLLNSISPSISHQNAAAASTAGSSGAGDDLSQGPPPRSVHGLVAFPTAPSLDLPVQGQSAKRTVRVLGVLFFGEGEGAPKELGHDGAGKFLSDTYLLTASQPTSTPTPTPTKPTSASTKTTPTFAFQPIALAPASSFTRTPKARGWFAYDAVSTGERSLQIVIHGGVDEGNARLGDAWSLDVRV